MWENLNFQGKIWIISSLELETLKLTNVTGMDIWILCNSLEAEQEPSTL